MSTGDNYLKWKQRAEQAERELAEVRGALAASVANTEAADRAANAATAARERAEADNAALLTTLRRYYDAERRNQTENGPTMGEWMHVLEEVEAMLVDTGHPGVGLLRRTRALESAAADALCALEEVRPSHPSAKALRGALESTADALKERKP